MKSFKWLLVLSMLILPLSAAPGQLAAQGVAGNVLLLKKNSNIMLFNGTEIQAAQPVTIRESSAYLPLNGISVPFGFTLTYDVKNREAVARSKTQELRFKAGSAVIKVDGKSVNGPGPVYNQNGYMMVPIRMWSNLTGSSIMASPTGEISINWQSQPSASFKVIPAEIYAGQTRVTYQDQATHPAGLKIVDERWTGREDIFMRAGTHTITRQVMDENGVWSEPFSVTIQVLQPNLPPVADFVTDKQTYRIGEQIKYTDRSTDDRNDIAEHKWNGNEPVFFEAGDKQVTLQVVDGEGLSHSVTKTLTVTSEVLYSREEYNMLFTPIGDKFTTDGGKVLTYESVPYTFQTERAQMVRSNSPETWTETGIAYDTWLTGKTRFLFYNQSGLNYNVKMHLIATNVNGSPAKIGVGAWGKGGPHIYSTLAGKLSTNRYLDALNKKTPVSYTTLRPGESREILTELSEVPIKPNEVYSAYADIVSDSNIRYRIVVVRAGEDPLKMLDRSDVMQRYDTHVRGTFNFADRSLLVTSRLGDAPQRIVLGDRTADTYLDGIDDATGRLEWNLGNFGVLYKMKVWVAPNTLIGLNARGGHYTGGFIVNGKLVDVTNNSILKDQQEMGVLHRTGDRAEQVEFLFTLASGSNLPVSMVFLPLPEKRA